MIDQTRWPGRVGYRLWAAAAVILACLSPVWAQEALSRKISIRNDARVEALLRDFEKKIPELMAKTGPPGLSVALVDRDGSVWARGFGMTDETNGRPVDPDTIFSIQSISKTYTATGILRAVQSGSLKLDVPITTYLPGFTVNSRFENHPEKRMTLRILLSHRGGFTHESLIGNNYYAEFPSFEAHVKSISDTWLRYPVGQRYSYSNLGIDLAGYILQVVSRKPFAQVMKDTVLDPLEMKSSSFDWTRTRANTNRAIGHAKGFSTVPLEFAIIPSGALYSSAADMTKYIQFQLNEGRVSGKSILDAKLLKEMGSIQFPLDGQESGYGLGVSRAKRNGSFLLNHGGGGFGFLSNMTWYPEYGIGIVVLTNSTDHPLMSLPNQILDGILKPYAEETKPAPAAGPKPWAASVSLIKKIIGTYVGRSDFLTIVEQNGKGVVNVSGKTAGTFEFISDSNAFLVQPSSATAHLRFFFAADGSPSFKVVIESGAAYDYNDGPNDGPGPGKPEWDRYVGKYAYMTWGQLERSIEVHRKNGYLYCDQLRLAEYMPGLFFSTTGEALDLRGDVPTWRNIRLVKKGEPQPAAPK